MRGGEAGEKGEGARCKWRGAAGGEGQGKNGGGASAKEWEGEGKARVIAKRSKHR